MGKERKRERKKNAWYKNNRNSIRDCHVYSWWHDSWDTFKSLQLLILASWLPHDYCFQVMIMWINCVPLCAPVIHLNALYVIIIVGQIHSISWKHVEIRYEVNVYSTSNISWKFIKSCWLKCVHMAHRQHAIHQTKKHDLIVRE